MDRSLDTIAYCSVCGDVLDTPVKIVRHGVLSVGVRPGHVCSAIAEERPSA